ncbi:MAG: peptidoglycan DD-metalloendopeptidase family protein [Gammaproteobacteria bacterium]|jgi:septal ring factor EnvC (AmiA/AmiB activator)|nr:peptidoglycan DD-metalloendopeptidase family protein [Gammaproteobacteria bacterium]
MGRRLVWPLAAALCVGIAAAAVKAPPPPPPTESDLKAREADLRQLRERIDALRVDEQATRDERDALLHDLESTDKRIGDLTRSLREIARKAPGLQKRLKGLEAEHKAARVRLDRERALLARQLRAGYVGGRQGRLQLLLRQEDPAVASRMSVYYDYFYRGRAAQVAAVHEAAGKLEAAEQALAKESAELAELQARESAEKAELESARGMRRAAAEALGIQLRAQGQTLAQLGRDEARMQRLLEQLRDALSSLPPGHPAAQPFASLKGRLPWPAAGALAVRFGDDRGNGLVADGVLIGAREGAEVRAVHHGRVAFADWLRGYGLLVIVDHGDGYMSLYGHNDSLLKEPGDWVAPGEVLALAGASGGRDDAAVYFAIRQQGRAVDPVGWCRRVQGNRVG